MRLANLEKIVGNLARAMGTLQITRDEAINVSSSLLWTPRQPLAASVYLFWSWMHLGCYANDHEDEECSDSD